jgi:hypothetical protein
VFELEGAPTIRSGILSVKISRAIQHHTIGKSLEKVGPKQFVIMGKVF